jgi:putative transcriptional regulator
LDPHFAKTVVLMIEHGPDGSMGFVINRPMPMNQRDSSFQKRYQIPAHIPVWVGGPVGSHKGAVIHNRGGDPQATTMAGNLRISSSEEALEGLVRFIEADEEELAMSGLSLLPYRFVIGYAGWGPKQLEQELKMGAWLQRPFDAKLIFDTPWQEIWGRAIDDLGISPLEIAPTTQTYLN